MGIGPFRRSCFTNSSPTAIPPNPNPSNYKLVREELVGQVLIVEVEYLGCTNFEGRKIMCYQGVRSFEELQTICKGVIDPHFSKSRKSPIARFKPTKSGWLMAKILAKSI